METGRPASLACERSADMLRVDGADVRELGQAAASASAVRSAGGACGLRRRTTRRVDETARDRASAYREKRLRWGRALVVKKVSAGQAAPPS